MLKPAFSMAAGIVGAFQGPYEITDIEASKSIVYAVGGNGSCYQSEAKGIFYVIDVQASGNPKLLASIENAGACGRDVDIYGNYAYVLFGSTLNVIDISDPTKPVVVGKALDKSGWASGVKISGQYAFIADDCSPGMFDISVPSNPTFIYPSHGCYGMEGDIFISGSYAFVTQSFEGVTIIDITHAPDLPKIGSFKNQQGIYVSGSFAYGTHTITDITDIANPVEVSAMPGNGEKNTAVYVSGSRAYVAALDLGVHIVDVVDPSSPVLIETVDTPGTATDIVAVGSHIFVADGAGGLLSIEDSSSVSPTASAGQDLTVWESSEVILDGSDSFGNGSLLSYTWRQTGGISVVIVNSTQAEAGFVAPAIDSDEEILTFELTVTNEQGESHSDSCKVIVRNIPAGRILFTSDRDGDFEIYTMAADGSDVTQLTLNTDKDSGGRFSPDGGAIAFVRNDSEIWIMEADGSNQRFLISGTSVAFSPDGSKLALAHDGNIFIYDLVTGSTSMLTQGDIYIPYSGENSSPDWSPDGQRIIYSHKFDGVYDHHQNIHLISASGPVNKMDLTYYEAAYAGQPRWSPDGSEIVFSLHADNQDEFLAIMEADGSNGKALAVASDGWFISPVWSPKGRDILCSYNGRIMALKRNEVNDNYWLTSDSEGTNYPLDWNSASGSILTLQPQGQEFFEYEAVSIPVISKDPATAKPIGIGPVSEGGNTITLTVSTEVFSQPADVYFAISAPAIDAGSIYLLTDTGLQPISAGLTPWKSGVTRLSESIFGAIDVSGLPSGLYSVYLAVAPVGKIDSYYLWKSSIYINP
jgi:Tol biopolymer transport system component